MPDTVASQAYVDQTGMKVILYNYSTSAYPARTAGVPAGLTTYQGPVEPTDWLDRDFWVDIS